VDRLRRALCVLPRDGQAWQAARRLHELTTARDEQPDQFTAFYQEI
jgi:hypothetical protein